MYTLLRPVVAVKYTRSACEMPPSGREMRNLAMRVEVDDYYLKIIFAITASKVFSKQHSMLFCLAR